MKRAVIEALVVASLFTGFNTQGFGQQPTGEQPDIGKIEYQSGCAACHGVDGKGNGPVAAFLLTQPADLTMITKKYNGAFPFGHIYDVIDGRQEVKAHGDRAMPVWAIDIRHHQFREAIRLHPILLILCLIERR